MSGAGLPALHHATGLPDFDAMRWTSLPPVEHVVRSGSDWGMVLQQPACPGRVAGPVEIVVPAPRSAVLIHLLAAGRAEGELRATDTTPPLRVAARRGDTLLLPPGTASRWRSAAGQERALHLHLSPCFLSRIARQAEIGQDSLSLPSGVLPRCRTRSWLMRQMVQELCDRPPGWRRALESTVILTAAHLLAPRAH